MSREGSDIVSTLRRIADEQPLLLSKPAKLSSVALYLRLAADLIEAQDAKITGSDALSHDHGMPSWEALDTMRRTLDWWMEFDRKSRTQAGLETTDDTYIVAPPTWPSHGVLKRWSESLSVSVNILRDRVSK
jgi:hypothetical protein